MSRQDEQFEAEAQLYYQYEMEALQRFARKRIQEEEEEDKRESDEENEDEQEEESEDSFQHYGVSARVELTVILSGGGPSMGYLLYVENGEVTQGYYWYQDWFQEKRKFLLTDDELDLVCEAYGIDPYYYSVNEG